MVTAHACHPFYPSVTESLEFPFRKKNITMFDGVPDFVKDKGTLPQSSMSPVVISL